MIKLLNLFGFKQGPAPEPISVPAWVIAARTQTGEQLARNLDFLYQTSEAKENLLREVEGLRRAVRMMGLDPAKVIERVLNDDNLSYEGVLFSAIVVNDQSLYECGLPEQAYPKWKAAYDSLKYKKTHQ